MSPSIPAPICGVRLERGRSRRAAPARAPPETANDPRHGPPRSARGRHHPHPLDRWRPAGELRAPRRTDGRRADDVRPVDPPSPPLAAEPGLAQPGPLRAVGRPRVDAPVLDAPPDGLRRQPRRPQGLPAVGLDHPGSPGIRPDLGGRGDDRTARPGPRERHRHGHRGAAAGGGVQPARARHRRPPDLRHRQRRRHAGGGRLRGLLAGRPPEAGQARRALRRQPDPARRADGVGVQRRRACPLRGLRLAHPAGRGRQRHRRDLGRHRCRQGRRPAVRHRRPHPHRLRQPEQAGHPEGARGAARAGRGEADQGGLRLGSGPHVLRARRRGRGVPPRDRRRQGPGR